MGPKWEFLLLLAIVLFLFLGPGRLAGLGGALGKSIKEFKEATKPEEHKPAASTEKGPGDKN
jgi:sec-independent protein translocase protein TatA